MQRRCGSSGSTILMAASTAAVRMMYSTRSSAAIAPVSACTSGHVAGGASFHAGAQLGEGDDGGTLFGLPLVDAMTAEIHTIVRSHGPAADLSGSELAAALHSVDGGCAPEFGPNACGDSQFAVFLSP